jgi:hypothetical protein
MYNPPIRRIGTKTPRKGVNLPKAVFDRIDETRALLSAEFGFSMTQAQAIEHLLNVFDKSRSTVTTDEIDSHLADPRD